MVEVSHLETSNSDVMLVGLYMNPETSSLV
jgi:hypothetical protein